MPSVLQVPSMTRTLKPHCSELGPRQLVKLAPRSQMLPVSSAGARLLCGWLCRCWVLLPSLWPCRQARPVQTPHFPSPPTCFPLRAFFPRRKGHTSYSAPGWQSQNHLKSFLLPLLHHPTEADCQFLNLWIPLHPQCYHLSPAIPCLSSSPSQSQCLAWDPLAGGCLQCLLSQ